MLHAKWRRGFSTDAASTWLSRIAGVEGLLTQLAALGQRLEKLETRVAGLAIGHEQFAVTATRHLAALQLATDTAIQDGLRQLSAKSDQVVADTTSRFAGLEASITAAQQQLGRSEPILASATARLDSLEGAVAASQQQLGRSELILANATTRLDGLEAAVTDVERGQTTLAVALARNERVRPP